MTEGTLEANLPTVWTDERKSEMGRVREEKRREEKTKLDDSVARKESRRRRQTESGRRR